MQSLRKESRECGECGTVSSFVLMAKRDACGRLMYFWQCQRCKNTGPRLFCNFKYSGMGIKPEGWVPHLTVRPNDYVPVIEDRTLPIESFEPCRVCGIQSRDNELHHWAPKFIFGWQEADRWPTDFLCAPHHRQWHKVINDWRKGGK